MFHLNIDSDFRAANSQAPIRLFEEAPANRLETAMCVLAMLAAIGLVWASPFLAELVR